MTLQRLARARDSFWLMPMLFGLGAIALAEGLVTLDRVLASQQVSIPFLNAMSASGGRSILSAVGGSVLTVAGTTFSITISVLATTSSTYGPRLVRNFMADRGNQLVLAVLTSTFLYSILVLRSVRTEEDGVTAFVPVVAIHVVVLLAVLDVAVLVYFIHHIADSVQVTTLQERVRRDLVAVVDDLYPVVDRDHDSRPDPLDSGPGRRIRSTGEGYVTAVDLDRLVELGRQHGCVLTLQAVPGSHVVVGETLAVVRPPVEDDDLAQGVGRALVLGSARTPHQDVRFALQQLTEIAVRGLASGSNDPFTPVGALDMMAGGLTALAARPPAPSGRTDADGDLRLVVPWPTAEELLVSVFQNVRRYAAGDVSVGTAAVRLATRVAAATDRSGVRAVLLEQVALTEETYAREPLAEADRAPLLAAVAELHRVARVANQGGNREDG